MAVLYLGEGQVAWALKADPHIYLHPILMCFLLVTMYVCAITVSRDFSLIPSSLLPQVETTLGSCLI